jgi:hypothetical protein
MLKKLIIGAVALLILAGAGGGGYFFFFMAEEGEEEVVEIIPGFIQLDTIATPIMQGERIGSYVYIGVTLEIVDLEDLDRVKRIVPTLRDAFLRDLHRDPVHNDGSITSFDMAAFKSRLLAVTREVMGDETVSAILISGTTVGAS